MMQRIPLLLIYSRLLIGIVIVLLSYFRINNYAFVAITLFSIGLLTDIFDGIIARHLKISNEGLRRLDSNIDQLFFISVAIATYIQCPDFFYSYRYELIILAAAEGMAYVISYIKFRKEVATHAIASKIWTLILFATLIQIMLTCKSEVLFQVCFYVGLITRFEIIGIILALPKWTNDVPSIYHAFLLRKGKEIKRNKIFNG